MRRIGLLFALTGALALLVAGSAQAFIYWASSQDAKIGRANNDGTGVDPHFIGTGAGSLPSGVAVDSHHIYWANEADDSIGRARLDGSHKNNSFITGASQPSGVAVTSSYIFWSSLNYEVGRANIDGSSPNPSLISSTEACGVAVDSGHVYWVRPGAPSYIGRADLQGGNVTQNFVTIPGTSFPCGDAVDSANIFWTDTGFGGGGTNIGRATKSTGMGADASVIGDASSPCGAAVRSSHLYWANEGTNTIGRANTDISHVNEHFVHTRGNHICGVAVDSLKPPQTTIDSAKIRQQDREATFRFSSSQAGSTFRCELDHSGFHACSPPKTYRHLETGAHTFQVEAKRPLGALDPTPAKKSFTITG